MLKKVSVVIPVYNVENHIKKSLDSLINQTFNLNDIEVIMVDDCSTDNSGVIIDEYASKYDNFRAIHLNQNSGSAGKPRNIGLKEASSDFVMFLDSDDYFVENAIERLYNLIIDDKDLDIVLGGYVNIHGDNEQVVLPPGNSSRTYIYDTNNDIDLIRINPSISAKIFKKSFLIDNNIRFPEGIPGQDLVFVLNSIFHAKKVLTLNNFIVYNRVLRFNELDKSISLNVTPKYLLGLIKAYNLTLNVCLDCNIKVDLIKLILISHLQFFNSQLSKKEVSSEELSDLFNSPIFNEFKNHDFFNIATEFKLIFNNIEKGIFYNSELISYIKTNIENNIFYKYEKVKNILNQYRYDNKILLKNLRIKDDENNYLKKENEQLNLELKNINSSKLLKFKNLF
ncbi:putative glycosyltransferase EpsJ [Methanobrevibacter woesei]|uniref:Putative glycosyltransferase EpsJ n=1 Tax=Methanobrevibacter woesei TaxID=190976 RepID=A0A2U1S982_9EURY|nr:glycosyltransferase family 2 protein [Methanobrevibacter woesei]PWB87046.1 putative glycosyltransferase EpsJ [Methanobrevibacter woesei]